MGTRRPVMLTLAAGIAIGGLLAGLVVTGAFDQAATEEPFPKQTLHAMETAQQVTAQAGPPATRRLPATPRVSCPSEDIPTIGIFLRDGRDPAPPLHAPGESAANALAANGTNYLIVTGTLDDQDQRWVIGVRPIHPDPCAVRHGLAPRGKEGLYEAGPGPVTLIQIDGDTIVFRTGDGKTGRLNYVTGTFLDIPPDATPAPTALP